jgi:gamma-glutamyltranspeptidase/glutathione hydrolase
VLHSVSLLVALFVATAALGQSAPQLASPRPDIPPVAAVTAQHGMVVAQEKQAARIGVQILERGGNAVDAAVAVGFALAVTYPRAGNLGGGGFMVIHLARGNRNTSIDFREAAPAAATPGMFLDAQGQPDPVKSRDTGLAVGVPGSVAGLLLAEQKYGSGRLKLADLIRPAIELAANGFIIDDDLADTLPRMRDRLGRWPSSARIFLQNNAMLQQGDRLVQPELADTLRAIAQSGARGFYEGRIAEQIAAAVRAAGGIMTANDLRNYRAVERPVMRGTYRGFAVISMPPPSSGGVCLIEMLNILEGYDLGRHGRGANAFHLEIEAMKRAYADRALFMGDPASVRMPLHELTSKAYAARQRASIGAHATPSADIRAGAPPHEGRNTTHYSVIDRAGNAVATTTTLNFSYGLGLVADGTGVLLNNELDDFTAKPGASNAYGLVGFEANLPGRNKRPLSSMTPTIVLKNGRPVLITGSPGGSRIITTVLQVIVNALDFKMPIASAVEAPRLHHQWMPDETDAEPGFSPAALENLRARGHTLDEIGPHSAANTIAVTPKGYVGAADSRTRGAAAVGY